MSTEGFNARQVIIDAIGEIAPDVDLTTLDAETILSEDLELDSMDMFNIAVSIFERTGVDIPERDYPKLTTVTAMEAYLTERWHSSPQGSGDRP